MSSTRGQHRHAFRPKLIALSVAACFGLSSTQSQANPTGGTVASGSASFASSGNTLTITNTANTIINWASFSIGVNEITRFLQSSASSAVLNRVVGANGVIPQSVIDGILSSNGRVFLLNPSGILIGSTARIDVAGFVASSLNLSDPDFLNGRLRFTETPGAGGVSNAGVIDTSAGGRVFLVAPDVQNSGIIRSPQGEIVLAAGKSVELVSEASPFVTVSLTADSEQALNVGQLLSESGRIGMFGALVRQGGAAEANGAVAGANGEIRLIATRDLTLDAGSRTTANGASGGNVTLQARQGTNLISGTVEARGDSGQGGTIQALGVRVGVIGSGVIDASGDSGGGTVLLGGDAHGANPEVQNADRTLIGTDGVIRADAGTTGDGGRVIVWSDAETRFYGAISARGGSRSGNGGFVETSGKVLQAFGSVDTSAPNGQGGNWLLDPDFINIVANTVAILPCPLPGAGICSILFNDLSNLIGQPGISEVSVSAIDAGLRSNGAVTLQAHQDIALLTDLILPTGLTVPGTFTAQAGNDINLGGFNITGSGTNITLIANDAASLTASGVGRITSLAGSGNITTGGGSVNLSGYGVAVGNINTSGLLGAGAVTIGDTFQPIASDIATGAITTASLTAGYGGGSVSLVTAAGKIAVNGSIDTHGANGDFYGFIDGMAGGDVTLYRTDATTPGAITVAGNLQTSGGYGVVSGTSIGQGGSGGSAGTIAIGGTVPMNGDILVQGGIFARGGDAAGSTAVGAAGGFGGFGGDITVQASGNVTVGGPNGPVDVSGGIGGAGGPAGGVSVPIAAGDGGDGGGGGLVDLVGGKLTVGNIVSTGGAAGRGGDGLSATQPGGSGGFGGFGGGATLTGGTSLLVAGAINASGGAGGVGGAYGGAGGIGGLGGIVLASGSGGSATLTGALDVSGGAGGAGGAGNGVLAGIGGSGGNGGFVFMVGDTIDLSKAGAIAASGGTGGAGGDGGGVAGGNGGNGGSGQLIELIYGSSILFTAPLTASVRGGAGGAGGAGLVAGIAGLPGIDGLVFVGNSFTDLTPRLDSNTLAASIGQATRFSVTLDITEKRIRKSDDKKGQAACN
ncbi:MAG: filamentous hemagglutinin N-terminal domain-containing protein [Burkholderiales bacterium]